MTDIALRNAEEHKDQLVKRRLQLHTEIARLDAQIGKIEEFIRTWHSFAAGNPESSVYNSIELEVNKIEQSVKKTTGNSPKEVVADKAREIILARGQPIMRDELYDILTGECGLIIHGKDPQAVLSTMLWRMKDRVIRLDSGGYWVPDVLNEDAGYDEVTAQDMFDDEFADADQAKRIKTRQGGEWPDDLGHPDD